MAVHPLRPATDRRLGGPLPRQQANQTRVHPVLPELFTPDHAVLCAYAVLASVSGCYPPVQGRFPTRYSPVRHSVTIFFPPEGSKKSASFDLHVLGTPPAFILSQDQTLMFLFLSESSVWLILFLLTVLGLHLSNAVPFLTLKNLLGFLWSFRFLSRLFHCSVFSVLLRCPHQRQLLYPITTFCSCQELFCSRKRRKRDLNPRAA